MEQSMDQNIAAGMASGAGKTKKGLMWGMIACAVLAIGGVAFGVYGMTEAGKKITETSDLKVQIEEEDGTTTTIDTEKVEVTEGDGTTVTISDSVIVNGGPYIDNGYFYIPKWGVKYKLSDNLTNYGYAVDQNSQMDSYGNYVVGLTAVSKSDYLAQPQDVYYNDIFSCSVVTVRAKEDSKKGWWGNDSTINFNGYNFVIHDTWRGTNCASENMAPTNAVAEQLKAILSNPEKI